MDENSRVAKSTARAKSRFQIYRASQAVDADSELIELTGITSVDEQGIARAIEAGFGDGAVVKQLFADPVSGFSLTYAWLKKGYMLPRHSHNTDCAYFVISGEAHLGTEILRTGDGFFVPAEHLYQYSAGPEGVEVMEFRAAISFNMRFSGNSAQFWARAANIAAANRDQWRAGPVPVVAQAVVGAGR
jgi:quercetin dioxygenase-like cupin family protein